jgi:olefin beta-lactone synthetase
VAERAPRRHNGSMPPERTNVADRLSQAAAAASDLLAVIACSTRGSRHVTFRQLDADATAVARGLVAAGVRPGTRLVLLVPPSPEFVTLVFALLRSGATTILIDPGMGRKHLVDCLAATEPEGFVAVSRAQAVRTVLRRRFPQAKLNVTVGRRWFWGGLTYRQLLLGAAGLDGNIKATGSAGGLRSNRERAERSPPAEPRAFISITHADDPAAIIFTSGSTGPPKGVLYTHRMFETQVAEIQRTYDLQHGGVDLACFALFGLFNAAMGVTTVFPEMDFSRPASAEPRELLAAANEWKVTQAFASPAVWDRLSRHCEQTGESIPTLRKIFSCGAPVPAEVLRRTLACVATSGAQMHTPYGATEALPISTIEAREILGETAAATSKGAGVCVGRKFDSIDWRVIRITDGPIASLDDAEELPRGEIGELIVCGPQVSPSYFVSPAPSPLRGGLGRGAEVRSRVNHPSLTLPIKGRGPDDSEVHNRLAKIVDGPIVWHRTGDVGSFDAEGRFWYHGRKSQRVETGRESLFTECVEAAFNKHPAVRRCALVGVGPPDRKRPVLVFELQADWKRRPLSAWAPYAERLVAMYAELMQLGRAAVPSGGEPITQFLLHDSLPVDVRHNAKINREQLAAWAEVELAKGETIDVIVPAARRTSEPHLPPSSLHPPG